jgi:hypothetical protein
MYMSTDIYVFNLGHNSGTDYNAGEGATSGNFLLYRNPQTKAYWNMPNPRMAPHLRPVVFLYSYSAPSSISVKMTIQVDNWCKWWVNGVAQNSIVTDSWPNGHIFTITLAQGINEFVFCCTNAGSASNPAQFAAQCYRPGVGVLFATTADKTGWTIFNHYFSSGIYILTNVMSFVADANDAPRIIGSTTRPPTGFQVFGVDIGNFIFKGNNTSSSGNYLSNGVFLNSQFVYI